MNWRGMPLRCKSCKKGLDIKGASLDREKLVECVHCGTKNLITHKKNGKRVIK